MMARVSRGAIFPIAAALLLAAAAWPVASVLFAISPAEAAAIVFATAGPAIRVSLVASLGATAVATILGVPAGYWLARSSGKLRSGAVFLLALPLAFPPVASGLMLLYALGRNAPAGAWLEAHGAAVPDTLLGVAVAEFFVSGSLVALAATAAFSALDPLYEDAARTLGAPEWRIFSRVALPAAAGNVTAGVAFAWLRAIGEYGATSVLAYHPTSLPVALYVTLSASGVRPALALCYGFVVLAALVLGMQWVLRRSVVPSP
jgi:ABC-type sulfate transport system permease component